MICSIKLTEVFLSPFRFSMLAHTSRPLQVSRFLRVTILWRLCHSSPPRCLQMADASATPFLGSKIVLISKSDIRYEGTLYTIDSNNSTVALQNVRSFGTEDRRTTGQIPPSNEIFNFIVFKGSDIKDLHVCEPAPTNTNTPSEPPSARPQPAPPQQTQPTQSAPPQTQPAAPAPPKAAWGANPSAARAAAPVTKSSSQPAMTKAPTTSNTTSNSQGRQHRKNDAAGGKEVGFDIQKMLDGFDKAMVLAEVGQKVKISQAYNKSRSFFDTLDEEANGIKKGGRAVMEGRKMDVETFGESIVRPPLGQGRGAGGRGRGRGTSRGAPLNADSRGRGRGDGRGQGRGSTRGRGSSGGARRRGRGADSAGGRGAAPVPVAPS